MIFMDEVPDDPRSRLLYEAGNSYLRFYHSYCNRIMGRRNVRDPFRSLFSTSRSEVALESDSARRPESPGGRSGSQQPNPPANPNRGSVSQQPNPPANPNRGSGSQQPNPPANPNRGSGSQQPNPPAKPNRGSGSQQPSRPADPNRGSGSQQPNRPADPNRDVASGSHGNGEHRTSPDVGSGRSETSPSAEEHEPEAREFRITPELYALFPTAPFRELGIDVTRDTLVLSRGSAYVERYTGDPDSGDGVQLTIRQLPPLPPMLRRPFRANQFDLNAAGNFSHVNGNGGFAGLHRNPDLDNLLNNERNVDTNAVDEAAAQARIRGLGTVTITKIHTEKGGQCAICLEDFRIRQKVRSLPCKHLFHNNCIVPWLEKNCTCPSCRKYVEIQAPPKHIPVVRRLSPRIGKALSKQSAGNREQAGPSISSQKPANMSARNVGPSVGNKNRSWKREPTKQSAKNPEPRRSTRNMKRLAVNSRA